MDAVTAATLLREKLELPRWAASISAWEVSGSKVIVVRVEQRYAHKLPNIPETFEGYPVVVQIRPMVVAHQTGLTCLV